MARTNLTTGQCHSSVRLKTKLAEHDTALDALEDVTPTIADDSITAAKLQADAVETAKIKDANVTAAKLASDAVETAKIKDANVTTAKLALQAVTAATIADATITATQLANASVGAAQMVDASVSTAKLASAITSIQTLSGAGAVNLTTGITSVSSTGGAQALTLADGTVTGFKKRIIMSVDGGSSVITAGASLHLANSVASITFTNANDWVELVWNGSAWLITGYYGVTIA